MWSYRKSILLVGWRLSDQIGNVIRWIIQERSFVVAGSQEKIQNACFWNHTTQIILQKLLATNLCQTNGKNAVFGKGKEKSNFTCIINSTFLGVVSHSLAT